MDKHSRAKGAGQRRNIYAEITDRILSELEAGRAPWVQPWATATAAVGMPFNAVSGRRYSGINILSLWHAIAERRFAGHGFVTFRQARELGGFVRRGEVGTDIIYTRRVATRDERRNAADEGREARATIPFLRHFTVFALEQCDGLPPDLAGAALPHDPALIVPAADALIRATAADFRIGGPSAFYSPTHDYVQVPRPQDFFEPINWHRTAFHELAHWSGHPSRLDRDQAGAFGSPEYGREELVAEMAGAFVCASLGIRPTVRHSDYLGSWLDILREDNRAILRAASAASRAADYLLGFQVKPSAIGSAT